MSSGTPPFFDSQTKRFVTVEQMWEQSKPRADAASAELATRLRDAEELAVSLKEARSVIGLREHDAVRKIQAEAAVLVQEIRRREEELCALVKGDYAEQQSKLAAAEERVRQAATHMRAALDVLTSEATPPGDRFAALAQSEALMRSSKFFAVPDLHNYTVHARPIVPEQLLSVNRKKAALHCPAALTIPVLDGSITIPPPPDAADGDVGSGSSSVAPGVLHYLGTCGKARDFQNPAVSQAVRLTATVPVVVGAIERLVDSALCDPPTTVRTKSELYARIVFDFGEQRTVDVTAYTLRHGHEETHAALRSWRLLGSTDGANWKTIDKRTSNALGAAPFNAVFFAAQSPVGPCRYVALEVSGPNAAGHLYNVELSHIELYGTVAAVE